MNDLKPGDRLPNGATVLLFHRFDDSPGLYPGGIVLAYEEGGKEFVTWTYAKPPTREGFCTTGQYRRDLMDALCDYIERTGKPRPVVLDPQTAREYEASFDAALSA